MPQLSVEVPHQLDQDEATRRLKDRASLLKDAFSEQVTDLEEQWGGDAVNFAFKAYGMKVKGSVTSEPSAVKVNVNLPLVAMMFKGKIEEQIKEHLGKVLV